MITHFYNSAELIPNPARQPIHYGIKSPSLVMSAIDVQEWLSVSDK